MKRQVLGGLLILAFVAISLALYITQGEAPGRPRLLSARAGVARQAQARVPLGPPRARAQSSQTGDVDLLARLITGEASGEPYEGMVAVGAVVMNRTRDSRFPHTISGVIYEPWAFESVENGLIWQRNPSNDAYQAATSAINGWDPAYGALFFWNPSKPVGPWIWSRPIIRYIGNHVFAH